jgi:hypothetical protein
MRYTIVVAGLCLATGCAQVRPPKQQQTLNETMAETNQQSFGLVVPTVTDMVKIRSVLAGQTLGRVTATADSKRAPYHLAQGYADVSEQDLDRAFLQDFHAGNYGKIDTHIAQFSTLLSTAPSPFLLARLGFLNVWRFAERYRSRTDAGPLANAEALQQALGACDQYFAAANSAAPHNAVYAGFAASCAMFMGQAPGGEARLLAGLSLAAESVQRYPEFNLFTIGYVLSFLPHSSQQFQLALEMLYRNLDVCFDAKVDRKNPNIAPFLHYYQPIAGKQACINSKTAPHNTEGFFLIFGDMLIKNNQPDIAKIMYKNATLLPSFHTWPYQNVLKARQEQAAQLVTAFQAPIDPFVKPNHPTTTFNTEYACMACHQNQQAAQ